MLARRMQGFLALAFPTEAETREISATQSAAAKDSIIMNWVLYDLRHTWPRAWPKLPHSAPMRRNENEFSFAA
jgi:hypothetical protein